MSFFDAGITLPPMVIDDTKLPSFVQDFNGYAIEGDMPYANTGDVVLCITGDGKIINALFSIFKLSIPVCRTNLSAASCLRSAVEKGPRGPHGIYIALSKG